MGISLPAVFRKLAENDIELTRRFVDSVEADYRRRTKNLTKGVDDVVPDEFKNTVGYELYVDMLSNEAAIAERVKSIAGELSIVALYRTVEVMTKRILAWRYARDKVKGLTAPRVAKLLSDDGIDMHAVPSFDVVDELRRLNNDIKHKHGLGEAFDEDDDYTLVERFATFSQAIPDYLFDLAVQVIPKDRQGQTV